VSRQRHQQDRESSAPKSEKKPQTAPRHDPPSAEPGNQGTQQLLEGKPLPAALRARIERSLGVSLHSVRVRQDAAAQEEARELDAEAFTHGDEIVLGASAPSPESPDAEPLLAHEAAHIVQQRRASRIENAVDAPGDQGHLLGASLPRQEVEKWLARDTKRRRIS
jgi:hypothetical protein